MTGQQVWEQALALLNYTDGEGRPGVQGGSALRGRALYLVNQMLRELWNTEQSAAFAPLAHLGEAVWLSGRAAEALPYGVAMLLAQGEGDNDNYAVFRTLYTQKRAALSVMTARQDVLPRVEG